MDKSYSLIFKQGNKETVVMTNSNKGLLIWKRKELETDPAYRNGKLIIK